MEEECLRPLHLHIGLEARLAARSIPDDERAVLILSPSCVSSAALSCDLQKLQSTGAAPTTLGPSPVGSTLLGMLRGSQTRPQ